jgi:hypothetical protein
MALLPSTGESMNTDLLGPFNKANLNPQEYFIHWPYKTEMKLEDDDPLHCGGNLSLFQIETLSVWIFEWNALLSAWI